MAKQAGAPQTNFGKIKIGTFFFASDGEKYKKTSDLTFDDMYGMEHYWDPMFDRKIGVAADAKADVDTSARIVKPGDEKPKAKPAKKAGKKK